MRQFAVFLVQGAAKKESPAASKAAAPAADDLIEINSASKEQLAILPGIGEVYSHKIIEGRPYANNSCLRRQSIASRTMGGMSSYRVMRRSSLASSSSGWPAAS